MLFAAEEHAWGGILNKFRHALPEVEFVAAGGYGTQSLQGFDVLIPTMTKIDARLLATADQLKLIQQIGAGLEGVDLEAAKQHQIAVANVPTDISGNADSVAELGIYMMLALARNAHAIPQHFRQRESGRPMGLGLKGKTVGLIGLGGIGKALAKRLTAFDMRLIGIKQHIDPSFAKTHHLDWLGTLNELPILLQQADFVVLSLPDSPQTHHILNQQTFRQMKAGSYLINLGRGATGGTPRPPKPPRGSTETVKLSPYPPRRGEQAANPWPGLHATRPRPPTDQSPCAWRWIIAPESS